MSSEENLMEQVKELLIERSKKPMDLAKQAVLSEPIKYEPLREALRYFMEEFWFDASHPTLLSLTCEAVGGNPEATADIASAFVLLAGAADIHDDIIDQSETKGSKPTVYGKYGKDIAIISSDILWFKGIFMLNEACAGFSPEKKQAILKLTKDAFFDIGSAEAREVSLRRNFDLDPETYLEIIKLKVSVAVAAAKIGAIIGNGSAQQVENLGKYGETLGTLMTIRDEFIDMFEVDELNNRFKNECLPLPILFAFQDCKLKKEILRNLGGKLTESQLQKTLELITNAPSVNKLLKEMGESLKYGVECLSCLKGEDGSLVKLLESSLQGLEEQKER